MRRSLAVTATTVVLMLAAAACQNQEDRSMNPTPSATASESPVCGLVDAALVQEALGTTSVRTTGSGAVPKSRRTVKPATCFIQPKDADRPTIQVQIGDTHDDADYWRGQLRAEAKKSGCDLTYTDEPGFGYACEYPTGIFAPGSAVNVLRGDRIVRVVIGKSRNSTHAERVALAERIVVDADNNLDAFDAKS